MQSVSREHLLGAFWLENAIVRFRLEHFGAAEIAGEESCFVSEVFNLLGAGFSGHFHLRLFFNCLITGAFGAW